MKEQSSYEKLFEQELISNEKIRLTFLAVIGVIVLFMISVLMLFPWQNSPDLKNNTPIFIILGILVLLIVRELNIKYFLISKIYKNKILFKNLPYFNLLFEISIPTAIIFVFFHFHESIVAFQTPAYSIYFFVIILTILNFDYKLSIFAGIIAAIEYYVLIYFSLPTIDAIEVLEPLYKLNFYFGRAFSFIVAGILAGFISHQLKKHVIKVYKTAEENSFIREMFGQQVSKEIAKELISNSNRIETQKKFVCVMFLDIRGFTPFAEQKSPEEIIDYQNKIFGFMIESILKHHGIINQFLGDGYMATFGAPVSHGNVCKNAVMAALDIITELGKRNRSKKIPFTRIGIGLHAGDVVAGNVGTDSRKQYSISGNTVILASRIEQLNKHYGSQVLVSKEVYEKSENKKLFEFVESTKVKGKEDLIDIYKLKTEEHC